MSTPQEESLLPTYAVLTSANKHIAIVCAQENQDYMTCKGKDPNPAACLEQGKKVTKCVANLYVCWEILLDGTSQYLNTGSQTSTPGARPTSKTITSAWITTGTDCAPQVASSSHQHTASLAAAASKSAAKSKRSLRTLAKSGHNQYLVGAPVQHRAIIKSL